MRSERQARVTSSLPITPGRHEQRRGYAARPPRVCAVDRYQTPRGWESTPRVFMCAHELMVATVVVADDVAQGARGAVVEIDVEGRREALHDVRNAGLGEDLVHPPHERRPLLLQVRPGLLPLQDLEGGQAGGDGRDVAVERAAVHGQGTLSRDSGVTQKVHDIGTTDDAGNREPAADGLAEGRQVRRHTVVPLGAREPDAKARDDLVEDEDAAVAVAGALSRRTSSRRPVR